MSILFSVRGCDDVRTAPVLVAVAVLVSPGVHPAPDAPAALEEEAACLWDAPCGRGDPYGQVLLWR